MEQMPLPERPAGKGASSGDEARPKQLSAVESGDQGRPRLKDSLADGSATIIKARGEFETEVRRAVASGGNTQSRPDVSATNPGATPAQVFHDKPVISPEASNPEGTRSRRDDARSERYVRENRQPLQADPEKAGQVQSADAAKMGLHLRHSGETRGPHAIDTSARPDPHRSDMISGDSSSIDASPAMAREIQVARSGAPTPTIGPTARAIAVVAEEIASNAPGEIEVSMSPEELGKVRIRMTVGEAGMFVNLAAERQETAELIRRHLSLLSDELARHGFDDVEFSFGERAGDDGQRHELPTNAPEHPTQTVTSAIPATHNSGRALDLRI